MTKALLESDRDQAALAARLKALLQGVFGDRLQGVVLYGSEVRREATPESDIDLLVLLTGPIALGQDLWTCLDALYPLQLDLDRPIHALPVDAHLYAKGEYALYRNARREGVHV
ncbi:MAG: nucleotidyltransferase domain-containing protein [Nitrospirae bacterium]|nr:MAG: nucleotidyltransferase domain-containing protein [Nitrospirota bacterium]